MANNAYDGMVITGASGLSALNTDLMSSQVNGYIEAALYNNFSCQIVASSGISSGQVTFEQSNDGTNWAIAAVEETAGTGAFGGVSNAALTIAASTARVFTGAIIGRYIRCRISTAFVGGTVQAHVVFKQAPRTPHRIQVANGTTASLLSTVTPASGTAHTANSAATTNATSVKASAGAVYSLILSNNNAASRFFKLYNKASAPTVGTDTPIAVIPIPATSSVSIDLGTLGQQFATGIAYAITGAITDADTTAIGAGEVKVAMTYI